jgi:phosphinothricin acetyltransferase
MSYIFEELSVKHKIAVIDIYNHYIENSFAAYPEQKVPYEFFDLMLNKIQGYPAYSIINTSINKVVGFCYLKMYHPFTAFKETAEITYFIEPLEVGKGIGKLALKLLEEKAQERGIRQILASISSKNEQSLIFHLKNGFKECGRFANVGKKNGNHFDIIWMQKTIS